MVLVCEGVMCRSTPEREVARVVRGGECGVWARTVVMAWPMPRFEPVMRMVLMDMLWNGMGTAVQGL